MTLKDRVEQLEKTHVDMLSGWGLLLGGLWSISSILFLVIAFSGGFNVAHHQNGSWECIEWKNVTVAELGAGDCFLDEVSNHYICSTTGSVNARVTSMVCVKEAWVRGVD